MYEAFLNPHLCDADDVILGVTNYRIAIIEYDHVISFLPDNVPYPEYETLYYNVGNN